MDKRLFAAFIVVVLVIPLFSGCLEEDNVEPNEKPVVIIDYPRNNAQVSNIITVSGTAFDPDGNDSNTYCWSFEFDNKYDRGIAFQSNDSEETWFDLEDPFDDPEYVECDFAFITYYQEPKSKEINLLEQLIEILIKRFPMLELLLN